MRYLGWAWEPYSESDPRSALVYNGDDLDAAHAAVIAAQGFWWAEGTPEHSYRRGDRSHSATTSDSLAVGTVPELDPNEIIVVPAQPGSLVWHGEGQIQRDDGATSELELVDEAVPEPTWRWTRWQT